MKLAAVVLLASLGWAAAVSDSSPSNGTINGTTAAAGAGQIVLVDAQHVSAPSIEQIMASVNLTGEHPSLKAVFNNSIFSGFSADLSPAAIASLKSTAGVVGVMNNTAIHMPGSNGTQVGSAAPAAAARPKRDIIYNRQSPWGLQRISQKDAMFASDGVVGDPTQAQFTYSFNRTNNQGKIDIYILDLAINADHVAFGGRARRGWRYGQSPVLGFSRLTQNWHLPVNWAYSNKLATAIAGVAGSDPYGVANSANIIGVQLGEVHVDTGSLFAGISYVVTEHNRNRGDHLASIVSLSLQWLDPLGHPYDWLMSRLTDIGVHVSVGAGDWGSNKCVWWPAQLGGSRSSVVTVGALDHADQKMATSNWGDCVDVYAPGATILSTGVTSSGRQNDGTTIESGTSIAAPFVAGLMAYLVALDPSLGQSPAKLKDKIKDLAIPVFSWQASTHLLLINNGHLETPAAAGP